MDKVFREAEEDTDPITEEEAYACAEKLSNRRTLLAGFLKLLMFSVVEPSVGVSVLGQFVKVGRLVNMFSYNPHNYL